MAPKDFGRPERAFFFFHTPPAKGVRRSNRKLPNPPYKGAPRWQVSVYYFWWEYLRRNDEYLRCCQRGGGGRLARLYDDFGDIYKVDFWTWWVRRGQFLFSEPRSRPVEMVNDPSEYEASDEQLLFSIPLNQNLTVSLRQIRKILSPQLKAKSEQRPMSRALYKVAAKPVLPALYQHLKIWDLHQAHPDWTYREVADAAGLIVATGGRRVESALAASDRWTNHRKILAVGRHLRLARAYIQNVAKGQFPMA